MQLATVSTRAQTGVEAPPVRVEVHVSAGLPSLSISGLVEAAVKESRDRVCAAIRNAGLNVPDGRIVVSLAPADLPKSGSRFDLPIALGILAASNQIPAARLKGIEFYGELGLSGELHGVPALLPAVMRSIEANTAVVVPANSPDDLSLLNSDQLMAAGHLLDVVRYLVDGEALQKVQPDAGKPGEEISVQDIEDFADVRGQQQAKRAFLIAAGGRHNILMTGSPGSGKSMLARRLSGILPGLTNAQSLETAALYSLAGRSLNDWSAVPFRAPHHTSSSVALVGGSAKPKPGEISLAHNGVLFLDEFPEFARPALEALREPLETGHITISRAGVSCEFPARFQLVAAMNPCPCGYAGDPHKDCSCSPDQVRRYQSRISGPLRDRFDISISLTRTPLIFAEDETKRETSAVMRTMLEPLWEKQLKRQGCLNAELTAPQIREYCRPDKEGMRMLEKAADRYAMSLRACDRVLKVARTIADISGCTKTNAPAIAEALSFKLDA